MVPAWSDADLTECPNDILHSVNLNSTSVIRVARYVNTIADLFTTNSTSFVDVDNFLYQGTDYYLNDDVLPKYLKIRASILSGTYDLQLIDELSTVLWSSIGNSNTTEQVILLDFDTISVPSSESILTLQVQTSGATCSITNVSLFAAISQQ